MLEDEEEARINTSFSARLEVELVFDQPTSIEEARERYINGDIDADNIVSEKITKVGY